MTARLFVRAVVVTDGNSPRLGAVLDAIAAQDFGPDSVHIASIGAFTAKAPAKLAARVTVVAEGSTFAQAIEAVEQAFPAHEAEFLWLLHDDTAPLPDALSRLAATARKRSRAAIVGAAQVQWKDTSRLISLGSTVSRFGARRVDLVDDNDINQGQYDARDDVLAVSTAGALVRREAWTKLGGLDPVYRGFGDSADFCRRAWRAGYDVVVVPGALVRHAQLHLRGARKGAVRAGTSTSYSLRRTGEWYHAAVWAPILLVPLLVLWAFASSVVRALIRIAQNEVGMAGVELAVPWRLVGRLGRLPKSRFRARRHATVRASAIRGLLASPAAVINHARTRYMRSYDRWRIAVTPTGMVRAELEDAATRRRWMLGVVVTLSLGASVAVFGAWVPDLVAGKMLAGSALGVTDVGWHELWQRTWTGWSQVGYGTPALDGTFAATMLPLAILPGGLRLWLGFALALAITLAAVSAWIAAGAATRAVSLRAIAALAYAFWPPFLASISQGRVGAVIAHILLPLVGLGVVRALGKHRGEALGGGEEYTARRFASPSAAAGASFALAACVAVAPVLLLPVVASLLVVAIVARRRWLRVVLVAVPALVVSAPAIAAAWATGELASAWAILARESGPSAQSVVGTPLDVILTLDTSQGEDAWYSAGAVVAAIAIVAWGGALLALLSGRAPTAVRIGWIVAAAGLATAFAAQRTIVTWPDGSGGEAANGWAAPGLSLALVGALAAATSAASGTWHSGGAIRVRRVAAVVTLTTATVAVLGSAVAWAWPGRPAAGDVAGVDTAVLPLVAALEQQPPDMQRVLVLTDTDDGVAFSVEYTDGAIVVAGGAGFDEDRVPLARPGTVAPPAPADLAQAVATLVGAGVGADEDLAAWGIGVIVATPGSDRSTAGLNQVGSLELMGASEFGTAYRVAPDGEEVSRAWLETADGVVAVPMRGATGGVSLAAREAGTLVIATPQDESWTASLDGRPLRVVADEAGRQAFEVPSGGGELDVRFDNADYRRWWWAAAIACAIALLASVPIHDRRLLGGRS